MNSQSILPASCTSSCLMFIIWSSRARNRSADPVVSCFFGRIAPSDAATESCFSIRGNREKEFASFQGLRHGNLAISSQQSRQKTTLAQWVRNSSRATKYLTSSPRQKPLSSPQVGHLLGKLVCVSSINQIASQGRNCARPTDTTRLPPTHLPNRDSDNSKSWLTTACATPGSGCR